MARLTKTQIVESLLAGERIEWKDAASKKSSIVLENAEQQRLLAFLLASSVRDVKSLPAIFVEGIASAYTAAEDPGTKSDLGGTSAPNSGPWKLQAIDAEGFGGVNAWNGPPFRLELQGESILLEGPNGSGKSSLTAAIVWAITGDRPRDQAEKPTDEMAPVFDTADAKIGEWPPVAAYPLDAKDIQNNLKVVVELTFQNSAGETAVLRRTFDGKNVTVSADPKLNISQILIEAGLIMPLRLAKLRFDQGRGKLSEAVQMLTGLDELIELGTFVQALCHYGREYLSYKKTELTSAKSEFQRQIREAGTALSKVGVVVPKFAPFDTDDPSARWVSSARN